ncbi:MULTISPECIES: LamG-like jellyroll fold domain-containing protein [Flavobacterium]|uniref:LamG-like jellyroll fold domain-containing protein n=1 Tax=Flavobacterium jumunjinense TaxID=998845 RepID=A0ABV5GSR9_9FLAO|nr:MULTISPECIES: LamG-like jellyroll fold domain-containing protein [Flavobacterium]
MKQIYLSFLLTIFGTFLSFSQIGTHLNFDGVDDYVVIPVTTINDLTQGTISSWVYLNSLSNQTICAKQDDNVGSYAILSVGGGGTSGEVFFQSKNNVTLTSNATLVTGQWYNIVVTFNTAEAKLYIDGVLDITVAADFSIPNNTSSTTVTSLGAWLGDGGGQYLDGTLDEFRVWNTVLTATDITNTKDCEAQAQSQLVAYYKFNQGFNGVDNTSITALVDASGNANGTLNNFARTGTTSNFLSGSPITTGNTCTNTTLSASNFEVANNIKIYPNPTNNFVTVEVNNLTSAKLQVVDIAGKVLMNQSLNTSSNTINVSQLPTGLYLFKVSSNEGTTISKIVKQ